MVLRAQLGRESAQWESRGEIRKHARREERYTGTQRAEESEAAESLNRRREWGLSSFFLHAYVSLLSDNILRVNSDQGSLILKVNPGWVALLDIRLHQVMGNCNALQSIA